MKMNKKGFTLIELLAVIVVLAIIALIATPIVMNTINTAKEGAAARSVEGYMKAKESAYYEAMLFDPDTVPNIETVSADYNGAVVTCEKIEPAAKGFKATGCQVEGTTGTFTYENGQATKDTVKAE